MTARDEAMDVVLAAWADDDRLRALHAADHDAIAATEAARALVAERFGTGGRNLFNACARLGALLAERGASPSLACATIDGAVRALAAAGAPPPPERVDPARASVVEAFVAAVREAERADARARWDYARCVVPTGEGAAAVACGHPTDDADALAAWAERIAARLSKAGVRRVTLGGDEAAMGELRSALELVGIAITGAAPTAGRGWLASLWRR